MDAGIRYNPSTNQLTTSASYANKAKEITITSDSENSNKYVTFVDGQGIKDLHMDAGIRYNPASNQLTVSSSYSNIAKEVTVTSNSANSNKYVTFVDGQGTRDLQMDAAIRYNPSTNQLIVSSSYSHLAKQITITSDSENSNKYLTFVDGQGTRDLHMDAGIRYNPASNQLTVSSSYSNVAKEVTITSNSANSNKYVTFADGQGTRDLQMDAGIRYNPSTNQLTVSSSYSNIAKEVTVTANSTNSDQYVTFVAGSGIRDLQLDAAIRYNPSTNLLTANVVGDLTGNADTATTATTATNVVITDNEGTDEDNAIVFVANADVDGNTSIGLESDGDLKYNPSTGRLTATQLAGDGSNITNLPSPPIDDIGSNFGDNNRLITAAGANAVNAEENLTFDGSTLAVTGAVTVSGNLSVSGTTTTVNSTQVDIGDRILTLNANSAAGNGGLHVNDATTAETGSLIWDSPGNYWKGGLTGSEVKLVTISSADTLENKSMSGDANTFTNIPNTALSNDGITIAGVDTSLGGTITSATILNGTNVVSSSAQVKTLLPTGTVSGSSIASSAQGEVALTTNGVAASAIDLGLQTTDTPTFAGLTINGNIGVTGDVTLGDALGDDINLNGHLTGSVGANISASFTSTGSFGRVQGTTLHGDGSGITNLPSPPIDTISNFDTNDRLITVAGANSVNAEPNLTFDGSELLVNGSVSGSTVRAARALYVAGYAGGAGTILDIASIGSSNWFIGKEPNFTPVTATQQNLIIGQGPVSMTAGDNVAVVMRNGASGGNPRTMRGGYNTIMGSRTAQAARGLLTHSTIIGASAAHQIVSSSHNTIIGMGAAFLFDGGISEQLDPGGFPYYTGQYNAVPNGEDSTYYQDRSKHNVFIGHNAATFFDPTRTHTTLEHTVNVPIAFRSGSYNTFVGDFTKPGAGFTQFETVLGTGVIGHGSYTSTIGSGSLYVSSQGDGDVYAGMFTGSSVNVDGNITGSNISASGNLHGTIATTTQNSITSATSLASVGTVTTGVWNSTFGTTAGGYISGSLGTNATLIRGLTAAGISGSLGSNATLIRSLTAASISGSLGTNATVIRSLTRASITGSTVLAEGSNQGQITHNNSAINVNALGTDDSPSFTGLTVSGLSNNKLTRTDGSSGVISADIDDFVSGTADQITVTDNADGTITLSTPQSINTTSNVQFNHITGSEISGSSGIFTSVNIDGGTIDGTTIATSNITVGSGKELDVSDGTLTLVDDQISGDKVEGGTIASTTITSLTSTNIVTTHLTASNNVSSSITSTGSFGFLNVPGDAIIGGTVRAQEFHTEFVSASVIFESGSTQFGDTLDDTHTFSGSLQITGSVTGSSDTSASFGHVLAFGDMEALGTGSFRTLNVVNQIESQGRTFSPGYTSTALNEFIDTDITGRLNVVGNITGSNFSGSLTSTGSFGRVEMSTGKVNGDFSITDDLVVTDDAQVGGVFSATGNTIFGNASSDIHTFTGHITSSGHISSSFTSTGSFGKVHGTTLTGTISTAAQPNITSLGTLSSIDIDGGNIDGATIATSDITVGNGKTLDVSAGTLTTSAAQNLAIIQGGSSNVDIGSFSLTAETLVSDVTTGTAPFTVSSTTAVSNLNADLLDGNHGSHYTDFTNMTVEAGEVTNTMLENNSISFGGVSVDLGSSNDTPAFDLQDATNYPGDSSLVTTGTVTTGVWDSTFGSTSSGLISGSLGPNASTIRTLTKAGISGSVTELSSSFSTRVTNLKTDSGSFSTRVTDLEDNTNDVTLAGGSKDYITLSGQVLTINQIDLTDDVTGALPLSNTALVAGTNITLDSNTLNVDDAFLKNDADDSTSGKITAGGFITSGHVTASLGVSGSVSSTGSFGRIETFGNIVPKVHNVSELGSPTNRWANIYSADLQLSNEDNEVGNEIDGTKGSWTIQEGEDDLYLLNRKNGKKYRFKLEEIT